MLLECEDLQLGFAFSEMARGNKLVDRKVSNTEASQRPSNISQGKQGVNSTSTCKIQHKSTGSMIEPDVVLRIFKQRAKTDPDTKTTRAGKRRSNALRTDMALNTNSPANKQAPFPPI